MSCLVFKKKTLILKTGARNTTHKNTGAGLSYYPGGNGRKITYVYQQDKHFF
jgi:hypothetical protein